MMLVFDIRRNAMNAASFEQVRSAAAFVAMFCRLDRLVWSILLSSFGPLVSLCTACVWQSITWNLLKCCQMSVFLTYYPHHICLRILPYVLIFLKKLAPSKIKNFIIIVNSFQKSLRNIFCWFCIFYYWLEMFCFFVNIVL